MATGIDIALLNKPSKLVADARVRCLLDYQPRDPVAAPVGSEFVLNHRTRLIPGIETASQAISTETGGFLGV
jgi:hypothetical protein